MMSEEQAQKARAHVDRYLGGSACPSCGDAAGWDVPPYIEHLPTTDFPETSAPKWRVFAATCRRCSYVMMYHAVGAGLVDDSDV